MMLGDVFPHPFPKAFNGAAHPLRERVQVGTVAGQGKQGEAQLSSGGLHDLGPMARCTVPNNDHRQVRVADPRLEMVEELDGMLTVAVALVPEKALAMTEVISPIPVDAVSQAGAVTETPDRFAGGRPGVSQVHVAVEMRFINVNQADFLLANLSKACLKLLNVSGSFLRFRLGEYFLTLFPTQAVGFEDAAQQIATHLALEDLLDPTAHFLQAPPVAGQAMVYGLALAHRLDYLSDLLLGKKGGRPPVR